MTIEIRLSGSGGQGIILAGEILAEALAIYEGKNVSLCTAYGGQVRGGSSRCDVLFCEEGQEIDFPEVVDADLLLTMTEESLKESVQNVKEKGVVIVDSTYIKEEVKSKGRIYSYPLTLTAKERLGTTMVANILALGMIAGITQIVSDKGLEWALAKRVSQKAKEVNERALQLGLELGKRMAEGKHED
jgi:2-oxoglutarate ferredoxin oxidoreductase subunit gamma